MKIEILRWIAAVLLVVLTGHTIYACFAESFSSSFKTIMDLVWGRQTIVDLYLGLILFVFIIYLHQQSWWVTLAWLIPTLILGNIVPLLYFVIYFHSIVAAFS